MQRYFIYLSFVSRTHTASHVDTNSILSNFLLSYKTQLLEIAIARSKLFTETDPAVPGSVYIFDVDRSENVALPPINRPERLRISKHLERTTPLYHTVRTDEDLKADSLLNERRSKHSSRQGPLVSDAAEI